jgi:hypothetical protein
VLKKNDLDNNEPFKKNKNELKLERMAQAELEQIYKFK